MIFGVATANYISGKSLTEDFRYINLTEYNSSQAYNCISQLYPNSCYKIWSITELTGKLIVNTRANKHMQAHTPMIQQWDSLISNYFKNITD